MEWGAGERAQPFPRPSLRMTFGPVCPRLCGPGRQESNVTRLERYHLSFRRPGTQPPQTTTQRMMPVSSLPIAVARGLFRKSSEHEKYKIDAYQ